MRVSKGVVVATTAVVVGAGLLFSQSLAVASAPAIVGASGDELDLATSGPATAGTWGSPTYFSDATELASLDAVAELASEHSAIGSFRSGEFAMTIVVPSGSPVPTTTQVNAFTVSFVESSFTSASLKATRSAVDEQLEVARDSAISYGVDYDAETDSVIVAGPLPAPLLSALNEIPGVTASEAEVAELQ